MWLRLLGIRLVGWKSKNLGTSIRIRVAMEYDVIHQRGFAVSKFQVQVHIQHFNLNIASTSIPIASTNRPQHSELELKL